MSYTSFLMRTGLYAYRAGDVFADLGDVLEAGLPPLVQAAYTVNGQRIEVRLRPEQQYSGWRSGAVAYLDGRWQWV